MRYRCSLIVMLAVSFWGTGMYFLWDMMPVAAREGWQPSEQERVMGLAGSTVFTQEVVAENNTHTYRVRDLNNGTVQKLFTIPSRQQNYYLYSPAGRYLVVATGDHMRTSGFNPNVKTASCLIVYDAMTGDILGEYQVSLTFRSTATSWFKFSHDGRLLGIENRDRIELWYVREKKRLFTLPRGDRTWCFSRDDKQIAMLEDGEITVVEIPGGRERCTFASPTGDRVVEFSPDGSLLLDERGRIWDLYNGKVRIDLTAILPGRVFASEFSSDSSEMHVVYLKKNELRLCRIDLTLAREDSIVDDRALMDHSPESVAIVNRRLSVYDRNKHIPPTDWQKWIGKIPGLSWVGKPKDKNHYLVADLDTGSILAEGIAKSVNLSDDGKYLLHETSHLGITIWDIPHRKPTRLMLIYSSLWTLLILLILWSVRRRNIDENAIRTSAKQTNSSVS